MENKRYISVADYAKLCGVSPRAIYARIESGTMELTEHPEVGGMYVDIEKYPPTRREGNYRTTKKDK